MKFRILTIFLMLCMVGKAQKNYSFRDSVDQKFDISEFLLNPEGFFPFVQLVTEPALGNIGVLGGPILIKPNKRPYEEKYTRPNVTALMGAYTANNSWFVGGLRSGVWTKPKLKYVGAGGYGSINLNFYREGLSGQERKFEFNFQSWLAFGSLLRQLGQSDWNLGLEYIFLSSVVSFEGSDRIPDFVEDIDLDSKLSSPGIVLELDKRDNAFSPNSGTYLNINFHINREWLGSDFDFENYEIILLQYFSPKPKWVSGLRFQTDIQGGDAPFYIKPSIKMRGVPAVKYQGKTAYTLETEQRIDVTNRWSVLVIGGVAKAVPENISFTDATLVYNYGTGFRYLISRLFKLRVGVDVAGSNEDFGYYIVFGSAWNQRN